MLDPETTAKFVEPPWDAPISLEDEMSAIGDNATVAGMFLASMVENAARIGKTLPSARSKYVRFNFYPQAEHARLLFEACALFFPRLPVRKALRKLGRATPGALLTSTVGKVVLISVPGIQGALEAISKSYEVSLRPGSAKVLMTADDHAVIELKNIYYFLDSHHVGVFEGICKHFDLRGHVRIHRTGRDSAQFLLTWSS